MKATHLLVAAGGAAGAIARYLVSGWLTNTFGHSAFQATLVVNLVACFLLGLSYGAILRPYPGGSRRRALIAVGFLGAFSTYSAFALEGMKWAEQAADVALARISGTVLWSLIIMWFGMKLGGVLDFFNSKGRSARNPWCGNYSREDCSKDAGLCP